MQHVVINFLVFEFLEVRSDSIINAQHVVSEAGDHEELLKHTVHVADAAQILESYVGLRTFILTRWLVVPLFRSFDIVNEGTKLFV